MSHLNSRSFEKDEKSWARNLETGDEVADDVVAAAASSSKLYSFAWNLVSRSSW